MNSEIKNKITELLIEESMKQLNSTIDTTLDEFKTSLEAKIDGIKTVANSQLRELESYVTLNKPLVVNLGTVEAPKEKLVHKSFSTIIKILSSTKRKEKNIMLVGGAGGGKTHLVGSIAEALKLQFYPMSVGLQTTKSDLLGFINANGIYIPSPIRLAYENGGVLLLDEFDAAHAGVITILNSLLANGHCSFPDKIVQKHKDFICLCACNTYGKGGTMDYVGRNRLDAATLDRFIIVDVEYDEQLENALTNNEQWTSIISQIRQTINKFGIKMIVSPRASMDGADLLDAGFNINDVLEMCIFKGCDNDVKTKILKDIKSLCKTKLPIQEKFDIDIKVDFDNLKYEVVCSEKFDTSNSREYDCIVGDFDVDMSNGFCPYLTSGTLYLTYGSRKFEDSSSYNRPSDITEFMSKLKESAGISRVLKETVRLTASYKGETVSYNFNTGEVDITSEVKRRIRK